MSARHLVVAWDSVLGDIQADVSALEAVHFAPAVPRGQGT